MQKPNKTAYLPIIAYPGPGLPAKMNADKPPLSLAVTRTLSTTMTRTPKKLQVIKQILELPEMIYVQTRFITEQAALQSQIRTTHTLDLCCAAKEKTVIPTAVAPVRTATVAIQTDGPYLMLDTAQQTEGPTTVSAGVQCNFKEDILLEDEEAKNQTAEHLTPDAVEADKDAPTKEAFLQFVSEKTHTYSNGKKECLLCGEIAAKTRAIREHMAQHWGSTMLCFRCGRQYENSTQLRLHRCDMKAHAKQQYFARSARQLHCPHYRCSVTAISTLELYDHISEHIGEKLYRCYGCQKRYATAGELRHHMTARLRCLEAKRRKQPFRLKSIFDGTYRPRLFRVYTLKRGRVFFKSFLSKRKATSRNRQCPICLHRSGNDFQFALHHKRCLKSYGMRMHRKRKIVRADSLNVCAPQP